MHLHKAIKFVLLSHQNIEDARKVFMHKTYIKKIIARLCIILFFMGIVLLISGVIATFLNNNNADLIITSGISISLAGSISHLLKLVK